MATVEPIPKVQQLRKILCPSRIPDSCTWRCTARPDQFLTALGLTSPQGRGTRKDLPSVPWSVVSSVRFPRSVRHSRPKQRALCLVVMAVKALLGKALLPGSWRRGSAGRIPA